MRKPTFEEPAHINSSYVILFHTVVLCTAPFITAAFPEQLRSDALMVAIVFPISLFWFSYVLKQFISSTLTLNVILAAAFVTAFLSFLNALYGDLSSSSVPVIYTRVPFFASLLAGLSGPPGLVYAGTILTYGIYNYIASVALASLLESVYESVIKPLTPQSIQKNLMRIDAKIDKNAVRIADTHFIYSQSVGLCICAGLISVYIILYVYLLIF